MSNGSKRRKKRRSQLKAGKYVLSSRLERSTQTVDPGAVRARAVLASVGVTRFNDAHLERRRLASRMSWNELIDQLVMEHAPEVLLAAVHDYFDASDLDLDIARGGDGIVLDRDGWRAVVQATGARLRVGDPIPGEFTADGPHWGRLRELLVVQRRRQLGLHVVREDTVTDPNAVQEQVVTEFPPPLGLFRAEVLAASARIRTDRSLHFDRPVEIEGPDFRIRFEPICNRRGPVELPFEYIGSGRSPVKAALRLRTPSDPLAIVCSPSVAPAELASAWGHALIAFAQLTCDAELVSSRSPRSERVTSRRPVRGMGGPDRGASRAEPRSVRRRSLEFSSAVLEPSGATLQVLACYVAGHRRQLSERRSASDSAKRAAAEVGIDLRPQETWVRPYARGVPADAELRFRWIASVAVSIAA